MRIVFLFITFLIGLGIFPELAFADDVYNFQFQKPAPIKPAPVAAPIAVVSAPGTAVTHAIVPVAKGWGVGVGIGGRVQTRAYDVQNAWSLNGSYQFSKYLGLEGQLLYGHDIDDNRDEHFAAALGGRVTPIHMQLFDWDFLDISGLVGVLTSVQEGDRSKPTLSIYVGYDVALNITSRFSLVSSQKFEEGDTGLYQTTVSGVFRF